ncbi:methylated-DNA--[protein]-cysteine S-methyltransferase [Pseudomonadota bacterium]
MMHYDYLDTVLGKIYLLADNKGLRQLIVGSAGFCPDVSWERNVDAMKPYINQLKEYLDGKRRTFTLPLAPQGTAFQQQVWHSLTEIPFGQTRNYQQIAKKIGKPLAGQAIGMAKNVNPIPIIIPCHRVRNGSDSLCGYRYGREMVSQLLALESGQVSLLNRS